MSRRPDAVDREEFAKSQREMLMIQIVAVHKALNKNEFPLKQKHARVLIVGTHKERSANIFWNTVSRIQLEKSPVLTWKFCHLLHKMIRDGHRRVVDDSFRYGPRIVQLGAFWQHLSNSGYGSANTAYCRLLSNRLEFHKRNNVVPGSIHLSETQLNSLMSDVNNAFELAIEMLDQMDDALNLQAVVFEAVECLRLSSLIPQGQCLLAPLILVILDTSKFYDYLVKIIFKLHSVLAPDQLAGHRERFYHIFAKTKRFYESSSNLQYFKYLVSIPSLPSSAPNFLQASDLDTYESPHAFLHGDAISEADTPPDSRSLNGNDTLIDISVVEPDLSSVVVPAPPSPAAVHQSNELIESLRRELEMSRLGNDQLRAEARSRLEQYESRLRHAEAERQQLSQELEGMRVEAAAIAERQAPTIADAERRVAASEDKFAKMKAVYNSLRQEHIDMLTKLASTQKEAERLETERSRLDADSRQLQQRLDELNREQALVREEALGSAASANAMQQRIDEMRVALERAQMETSVAKEQARNDLQRAVDAHSAALAELNTRILKSICDALRALVERVVQDLDPGENMHTASADYTLQKLPVCLGSLQGMQAHLTNAGADSGMSLCVTTLTAMFDLVGVLPLACAAAGSSDDVHATVVAQCKDLTSTAAMMLKSEGDGVWQTAQDCNLALQSGLRSLENVLRALPAPSKDVNPNEVGSQLEEEMKKMDAAIEAAAAMIQEIQRKARETDSGVRLEVNEKILETCTSLMAAIRILVARSRALQNEIVAAGRGSGSPREFYKRNHQWTEGLLSAAKAVGVCAFTLVQTADEVISGRGKLEQLIVASQEIAASTAQLFVSSRVKAERDSRALGELSDASRSVNTCTAAVVASVRSAQDTLTDKQSLDFSHLTLHQAKRMEMESQVRTLELEALLEKERTRLSLLRKTHYHLASLVATDNSEKDRSPEQ